MWMPSARRKGGGGGYLAKGPSFKRKKKTKREKQAKGKRRGKVSRFKKPDPKGPVYLPK